MILQKLIVQTLWFSEKVALNFKMAISYCYKRNNDTYETKVIHNLRTRLHFSFIILRQVRYIIIINYLNSYKKYSSLKLKYFCCSDTTDIHSAENILFNSERINRYCIKLFPELTSS